MLKHNDVVVIICMSQNVSIEENVFRHKFWGQYQLGNCSGTNHQLTKMKVVLVSMLLCLLVTLAMSWECKYETPGLETNKYLFSTFHFCRG